MRPMKFGCIICFLKKIREGACGRFKLLFGGKEIGGGLAAVQIPILSRRRGRAVPYGLLLSDCCTSYMILDTLLLLPEIYKILNFVVVII